MDLSLILSGAAFLLNVLIVVVTGVVVVGRIEKTTAVLGNDMLHLTEAIRGLSNKHDGFDVRLREAEIRLGILEDEKHNP